MRCTHQRRRLTAALAAAGVLSGCVMHIMYNGTLQRVCNNLKTNGVSPFWVIVAHGSAALCAHAGMTGQLARWLPHTLGQWQAHRTVSEHLGYAGD